MEIAVYEVVKGLARRTKHLLGFQERFIKGLKHLEGYRLHGDRHCRLPGNVNVSFDRASGESLVRMLDKKGISCSTGSACTSGEMTPSHVLLALGISAEQALGALRFTFSEENTQADIDAILSALKAALKKLQSISSVLSSECCCPDGCCS